MDVSNLFGQAARGLTAARLPEAEQIVDALQGGRVVGVLGEAEIGKSAVIEAALAPREEAGELLRINLDGAAGEQQLAFRIVKQAAAAYLGATAFSLLSAGVLVPASVENKRIELGRLIGVDGLEEAVRAWPSGTLRLDRALLAIERFCAERDTVVWIDHPEAPSLTLRHPLDVDGLLWALRAMQPKAERLSVVVSGRSAFESELLGPRQAFHQQGRWLTLDNPAAASWRDVGGGLGVRNDLIEELVLLTAGHPQTRLRALAAAADQEFPVGVEIIRGLASTSQPLVARTVQHAYSLHRLGGQTLAQVARGEPPYGQSQRGAAPQQEITRVLRRLRLAGLLRRDPGGWSVVDPLVGTILRGEVRPAIAADLD
jgi:hypothetical protein